MNDEARVRQDFEDARFGRGTRLMNYHEASALLSHCDAIGWAFQFMEAFECTDGKELDCIKFSILGLTHAERSASSLTDLSQIARDRLEQTRAEPNPFLFQVWVDTADSVIAKRKRS